jgi:hypothetical protein
MIKYHNINVMNKIIIINIHIHLIHKINHFKIIKKNNLIINIIVKKFNKPELKFKLY